LYLYIRHEFSISPSSPYQESISNTTVSMIVSIKRLPSTNAMFPVPIPSIIYKRVKIPPPRPATIKLTNPTTTLLQANGSGPGPAALFFVLELPLVAVAANPLAALSPVAVGL
jgi:hypothetical protein